MLCLSHISLLTSIVQGQVYGIAEPGTVQVSRYRLSRPLHALVKRLPVGGVGVGLGKDVTVAIFVERVLGWIAGRGDFG